MMQPYGGGYGSQLLGPSTSAYGSNRGYLSYPSSRLSAIAPGGGAGPGLMMRTQNNLQLY
jgi:hypothetical protein